MKRFLFVLLVMDFLAGCAPGSVIKDAPTGTPAQDELVITYQTSGGIAGMTTTWNVYATGKIVSDSGKAFNVTPEQVSALRDQLISAGFAAQAKDMPRVKPCPDCTQTDLTGMVDGQPVTLSVINEAADTPAAVAGLVQKVSAFIAEGQTK